MINTIKLNLFGIISLLVFILSKPSFGRQIDTPTITIKAGNAKITGSIIYPNKSNDDSVIVTVVVPHPISGEFGRYRALVDRSGRFAIDVAIETTVTLATLNTSLNPEKSLFVKLANDNSTNIDLTYNSDLNIENINTIPVANHNDMTQGMELIYKMMSYRGNRSPQPLYDKSTDYFLNYAKTILSERLSIVNKDTLISKELKSILSKDFSLILYRSHVLPYEDEMTVNYRNMNKDKSENPDIQKIDRTCKLA